MSAPCCPYHEVVGSSGARVACGPAPTPLPPRDSYDERVHEAIADVMWRAQPYGSVDDGTEDGDTFAYLVTKGAMHRLIGIAQQNPYGVTVAFRAASPGEKS